jgi:hypothetical protein
VPTASLGAGSGGGLPGLAGARARYPKRRLRSNVTMQVLVGVPVAYRRGRVGILLEVAVQWNKIGSALAGVADQLGLEVPGVVVGPVTGAVGGVAEAASGAGSEVTSAAKGVLDGVTRPVTDAIAEAAEDVTSQVQP